MLFIWFIGFVSVVAGNTTTSTQKNLSRTSVLTLPTGHATVTSVVTMAISWLNITSTASSTEFLNKTTALTTSSRPYKGPTVSVNKTQFLDKLSPSTVIGNKTTVRRKETVRKTTSSREYKLTTFPSILATKPQTLVFTTLFTTNITLQPSSYTVKKSIRPQSRSKEPSTSVISVHHSKATEPTKSTEATKKTTTASPAIMFGMNEEQLRYAVLGAFILAGISVILLIIVCCYCRCQMKRLRKQLRIKDTTLGNPYCNMDGNLGNVPLAFPSPVQLDTFNSVGKTESPYDMPDPAVVSYVTVVDESTENQCTSAGTDEMSNKIQENGTAGSEPSGTPLYTNASVFSDEENNPYEELRSKDRGKDEHYESLIKKKEDEDAAV